ncbi:MAG: hypothetical protein P4M10_07660 [Verrucomicrobiae bacterium]|nr:hypothetical protein [Verrucomicrobiae bacterium]
MLCQQFANSSARISWPKAAFGICVAVLLVGSAPPPAFADESVNDDLPTVQIFKRVKDTYASMITYSDEGCVVTARGTIINFSTRLARTNFYLIEWRGTNPTAGSARQAVWYSGAGDFLQADAGVQFQGDRKLALAHASASSGGVTRTVPQVFFNLQWEDEPIDDLEFSLTRQADEKVENVSCYVFARGAMGTTNTLWIGKQDFLIHQARMVVNMESMPAFTATETHTNIVQNQSFSRSDFVPSCPLFQSSED